MVILALILVGSIVASTLVGGGQPSRNGPSPNGSTAASVNVPDVRGLLLPDATAQLQAAGLHWTVVTQPAPDGVTQGTVFDTKPSAGTPVAPGSSITLYVAAPCGTVGGHGKHNKHCGGGG